MDGHNLAAQYGLTVRTTPLPQGQLGAWDDTHRTIWVRPGLTRAEHRSVVAHEIAHALAGHTTCQPAHVENRVDEQAAQLLISTTEYALAERLVGADVTALADELEVTPRMIKAWRRAHLRTRTGQENGAREMAALRFR